MIISHSVLQIFDIRSGNTMISDTELDLSSETTIEYLLNTLKKITINPGKRRGVFNPQSKFIELISKYRNEEIKFMDLAGIITNDLKDILFTSDDHTSIDLLVSQFKEEAKEYLAILLLPNKESITHTVSLNDGKNSNFIVKNFSILPQNSANLSSYAYIDLESLEVYSIDKVREMSGQKHKILEEYLNTTFEMSMQEEFKIIKNVTAKVCEEHGINPCIAMTKVKSFLNEKEMIDKMDVAEIAEAVFEKSEAKEDFNAKMHSRGLAANVSLEHEFVAKKAMSHKIKTDSGIEITFPSEIYEDNSHLEFVDEEDGTISIKIKNINKIINR